MTFFANVGSTNGCCGVRQVFDIGTVELDHSSSMWEIEFSVEADTWEEIFEKVSEDVEPGIVMQVWFAEHCDWEGRRVGHWGGGQGFRDVVRAIPDVVSLGEFKNPNSGNFIDGYQWVNK